MKHTLEDVNNAILTIMPESVAWGLIGRESLLIMCAKQIFMYPENFESPESVIAVGIIRDAMIELTSVGWMNFGE